MPLIYNEFEVYIPSLSSVQLIDTATIGGELHYYYIVTYNFTPVSTQDLDYNDDGTNVDLEWNYRTGMVITGGEGFNSATSEQTSMSFYVDTTGGGWLRLQTKNVRADTSVNIGNFWTSKVYLAPGTPTVTAEYTHYINESSYRKITCNANTISEKPLDTKMKLTAHYYDTPGDEQVLELGEIEPDGAGIFVFKDYNNYNASNLYYSAIVTQYNKKGDQDFNFESAEATVSLSPYIQPYPAVIYGQRASSGELLCVTNEGLHLDWTFMSRDGSEQQSYTIKLLNSLNQEICSKSGGSEQYCDFTVAEIGGPDTQQDLEIRLETYGLSSDPALTTDFVFCAWDPEVTMTYSYDYAEQLIKTTLATGWQKDILELTAYVAIKDPLGNVLYNTTSSIWDNSSEAHFTININEIEGYTATDPYLMEYKIFSNVLEGYVDEHEDVLNYPGYTPPDAPNIIYSEVDDYCYITVQPAAGTNFVDVICRYESEEIYIAERDAISGNKLYRFNTPPIGIDFTITAVAYDNFYTPSDETDEIDGFIQCNNFVYVNYVSDNDVDQDNYISKYVSKFGVKVNASFGESISNNLQQYNIIGKYDAVTKPEGNANRTMSLEGEIAYAETDVRLFNTFSEKAMKCIIRVPKSKVFYCYITSADIKKSAGKRNATVSLKLNIDSSIASEITSKYSPCEATLAYVESVLAQLL